MLTDAAIRAAIRAKKQTTLRDAGRRGEGRLTLMIRPPMAEWYAAHFIDGKRRLTKLGNYPDMGLADARTAFREPRTQPVAGAPTLTDLIEAYAASLRDRGAKRPADTRSVLLRVATTIGPDRPLAEITEHDVVAALRPVFLRGSRSMASKSRAVLRAAFAWALASELDYRATHARKWGITSNPVASIPRDEGAFRPGERFLSEREFADVLRHWQGSSIKPSARAALVIHMLTGQRVEEVIRAEYRDGWMTLTDTKNGRPHAVPLPAQALPFAGVPMDDLTPQQLRRYKTRAFGTSFCLRDIRRTWKTLAGKAGISKEMRDILQNHARLDVSSRHYDRHDYRAEKLAACRQWEAYVTSICIG